ncbi:uncharacterized protein LOC124451977 isoform X2 [Xenia sp. Carnegie-2017]|uniref:uncharacterized protein LOC124451977 isoform X2 n=1 Tax=Xenia sp. Carnegie-2017 TaxID=2897299 RepID=UPI001F04C217|nr:uncharacterized protein LOC124451977 isoform X2 [Xenia sp. Carnegie-2017]
MFSLSLQDKSTDLQPKRSTSMKPSLPSRKSYVIASPIRKTIPKDLKTVRRSCPQKLEKTNGTMAGYSSNNKLTTEDSEDEDIKMIKDLIEEHNQKILGRKILYDDNGRRIRRTDLPQRIKKKENIKPTCTISINKKSKEDSLENDMAIRELIEKHNQRILSKTSKYDLNGRRICKGNTTAVAPSSVMKEKGKTDNKTHCMFMPKNTRRSGLHQTEKQEMHTTLTRTKSHRRSHIVDQEKQKIPIRKS